MIAQATNPRGQCLVIYQDHNDERQSIYLGTLSSRNASQARRYINALVRARRTGKPPNSKVISWALYSRAHITLALYRLGLLELPKGIVCGKKPFSQRDESVYQISREGVSDRWVFIKETEAQQC